MPAVVVPVTAGEASLTLEVLGHQPYNHDGVYSSFSPQKNEDVLPLDGATVMISSEPVVIQSQVGKNIFMVNVPNDQGGYSTVVMQKAGDRFMEVGVGFYPILPKLE